eukprot:TRINITY_DN1466_c0_g2_i1.p1 TRINITY_DN1466_c0_g2~~TRINITY_DN1466_c0_g2_i1.p1  ORF type:complete len:540 (+),score=70.00 TRINITY_DN1466_c0_g2_i1:1220-2839(+)
MDNDVHALCKHSVSLFLDNSLQYYMNEGSDYIKLTTYYCSYFYHNLVIMEDTNTFLTVIVANSNTVVYFSYNNIYINWNFDSTQPANYSSNVIVNKANTADLCTDITFNTSNACVTDDQVVFDNLAANKYKIILGGETIDKGIVISGWVDVNGPSIDRPDIGPFESNQYPDENWPFSDPITDCAWSAWTSWSPCTCGSQQRTRFILIPNNPAGLPCNGTDYEMNSCSSSCPVVNCSWSEWSLWTLCNCGITTRQRTIAQQNNSLGYPCDGPFSENISCTYPLCDSSNGVTVTGIDNYTSTTNISNTTVNIQNVSSFVSEATNITNSSVYISNTNSTFLASTIINTNITLNTHSSIISYSNVITSSTISVTESKVELFSNNIVSTLINLTESTLHYQRNIVLTSNSVMISQDSNISVSGNLTIDPDSQISLDEKSLIQISGCLDANKITITPSSSRRQQLQNTNNVNALIEAACFSKEVQIVNEKNEVCKKRVESKLNSLFLFVDYDQCGNVQVSGGMKLTSSSWSMFISGSLTLFALMM